MNRLAFGAILAAAGCASLTGNDDNLVALEADNAEFADKQNRTDELESEISELEATISDLAPEYGYTTLEEPFFNFAVYGPLAGFVSIDPIQQQLVV